MSNDPNCRARMSPGHVCFDMRGNPVDADCFFETVSRLDDRARELAAQVSAFVAEVAKFSPPAGR